MIRRVRHLLRWFAVFAALLLVALPVQADDIEPEPYVEEAVEPEPYVEQEVEPEPEREVAVKYQERTATATVIYDCAILRPFGFVATLVGAAFFVPAAVLASASGTYGIAEAWDIFVVEQVEYTFTRPLGKF